MLMLVTGSGVLEETACWYWLYRLCPAANVVNATGMVGTNGVPAASTRLPTSRSVRPGLPSLKMITPVAPAPCAFCTFTPKLQPPRWISAIRPGTKPVKSVELHPLVELDVAVGGRMMPPAGLHLGRDVVRGRLVPGLAGVPRRVAVWTRIRIGDRLEVLHDRPEVVLLDARQKLARRVVDLRVALSRRDRARVHRGEQCYDDGAERDEPRTWPS